MVDVQKPIGLPPAAPDAAKAPDNAEQVRTPPRNSNPCCWGR
jgi:hypothetical protein